MRKAINDNPVVQIAVIGVLVVVVGLFMMTNLKKKSSSSTSASSSSGVSSSSAGGTTAPVVGATSGDSSSGSVGAVPPPPSTTGSVSPEALIPGPGLPRNVVAAWKHGNAVVLLIVRGGGIDDRLVRGAVR